MKWTIPTDEAKDQELKIIWEILKSMATNNKYHTQNKNKKFFQQQLTSDFKVKCATFIYCGSDTPGIKTYSGILT